MLNLPRWQTAVIIAITVLSGLFALPNMLPASVLDALPHWYSQNRINLGLDLRGGAHFLLEVDLRGVLTERLTNLSDLVRADMRKQQVGLKDVLLSGELDLEGSPTALVAFFALLDGADGNFPIVTP